ncbi:MFS transporter [Virgisporangium aurantiacum]|uniref:MFS transporter n=1 Tax=Virgisporangium aurantiacum TaxID=175570 RepID=A0A8J4E5L7_9ACTN|nr:MFS transporter [Virgisporangium aurantiacum]GIJ62244.1 MFS transporter [Virgisporangium aurantiacum]
MGGAASGRRIRRSGDARTLLARPAFVRLWIAALISRTGDWLLLVALPVFLLQETGSVAATSTMLLIELVTRVGSGHLLGVLADRYDRRSLVTWTSIGQAAALLPLLAAQGDRLVVIVYAVAAVEAVLGTLAGVTLAALLPDIVDGADLIRARGLLGMTSDIGRFAGATAAGFVLAGGGMTGVVLVDTGSFLAVWLVFATRLDRAVAATPAGKARTGFLASWTTGLAAVRRDRRLWGAVVVTGCTATAQGILLIALVLFVLAVLHGSAAQVGVFRGVVGAGAFAGAALVSALGERIAPHLLAGGSLVLTAVLLVAIWNAPQWTTAWPYYVVMLTLLGLPAVASFTALSVLVQRHAPRAGRGRVFGLLASVNSGGQGLGLLLGGGLVDAVGPTVMLNGQAALTLVAGVVALTVLRPAPGAHRQVA